MGSLRIQEFGKPENQAAKAHRVRRLSKVQRAEGMAEKDWRRVVKIKAFEIKDF